MISAGLDDLVCIHRYVCRFGECLNVCMYIYMHVFVYDMCMSIHMARLVCICRCACAARENLANIYILEGSITVRRANVVGVESGFRSGLA